MVELEKHVHGADGIPIELKRIVIMKYWIRGVRRRSPIR